MSLNVSVRAYCCGCDVERIVEFGEKFEGEIPDMLRAAGWLVTRTLEGHRQFYCPECARRRRDDAEGI